MNKIYKSKIGKWYVGLCIAMTVLFIGSIFLCYQSSWVLLIDVVSMGLGIALLLDMLFHTDYTIEGDKLHIRCGVLFRMKVPISKISEITRKPTLLCSPALSAERIGLKYGKTNWVYVSPSNPDDFIASLTSINPGIKVI